MERDGQCYVYDFTAYFDDIEEAKKFLNLHCRVWDFQQEMCPTTQRLHLQGRVSLKTKRTLKSTIILFHDLNKAHVSKTSVANKKNVDYVCKEETRVQGPWSSKDKALYIPIQFRVVIELRPWQQSVLDVPFSLEKINILYDPIGGIGKSTFVGHMCLHKKAQDIPFCNDYRDIMRMIMNKPKSSLYFIDLPRAIPKNKLGLMYSGIETIKGGRCFDDRYKWEEMWFDTPTIWVFTNTMPDFSYLTERRWSFWHVVNNELKALDPSPKGNNEVITSLNLLELQQKVNKDVSQPLTKIRVDPNKDIHDLLEIMNIKPPL